MLGLALSAREQLHDATKHLQKAFDLERGSHQGSYMVEEIWQELAKSLYRLWQAEASIRERQQQELRDRLFVLLKEDYDNKLMKLKVGASTEHAQPNYREDRDGVIHLNDDEVVLSAIQNAYFPAMELQSTPDERRKAEVSELTEEFQTRLRTMEEVFDKAGAQDRPGDVPDYLCCQITMDIFRDPVITPSGVTYEREVLMEHLRRVGKFDPLTRATFKGFLEPQEKR
jgi:STIP1 family protein 1